MRGAGGDKVRIPSSVNGLLAGHRQFDLAVQDDDPLRRVRFLRRVDVGLERDEDHLFVFALQEVRAYALAGDVGPRQVGNYFREEFLWY